MYETTKTIRIYRRSELVAYEIDDADPIYLTEDTAFSFGLALARCADDIRHNRAGASSLPMETITSTI